MSKLLPETALDRADGRLALATEEDAQTFAHPQLLTGGSSTLVWRLARGISLVFSPATISVPFVLLVSLYRSSSLWPSL
ncbi:hypothetical protein, partial [Thermogemmatispora sp.]